MKYLAYITMGLLLLVSSLCLATELHAQKIELPLTIKNITPVKTGEFLFTVGAHPQGTNGLDTAIGEREIPSIPLPGDIYYVWTIAPYEEEIWLSPREYRKLLPDSAFMESYDLRINWSGGKVEITWPGKLHEGIDSAWITDGYSDFPDNFLSAKVTPGGKFLTDNPSITRLKVLVWYNSKVLSVDDDRGMEERGNGIAHIPHIGIAPHPAVGMTKITCTSNISQIVVTDASGRELIQFQAQNQTECLVNLSDLCSGLYTLCVVEQGGNTNCIPFIHE